jgi:hypothetical protein
MLRQASGVAQVSLVEESVRGFASIDAHGSGHPWKGQSMLARLKAFLARSRERESQRIGDEYATMSPREREEAELVRREGAAGEREVLIEREAARAEEQQEGRPPDY